MSLLPKLYEIKKMRIGYGISQRQLAIMSNVSPSMINQIESGITKPSYETATRIFKVLDERKLINRLRIYIRGRSQ